MTSENKDSKLKEELVKARIEIQDLKEENYKLRKLLGKSDSVNDPSIEEQVPEHEEGEDSIAHTVEDNQFINDFYQVNKLSTPEQKIALFRSLFKGRDDVYAIRWSGKGGKSGYSPACVNDWKPGICGRFQRVSCANCDHRELIAITDKVIFGHLNGDVVMGLYPLMPDDSCYFLALDFDKKDWQSDVIAFRETCQVNKVPAYIERSRSGNGAHVWIFFEKPVIAHIARKLGCALLTATMENRHEIGLDSYDRLFPNQDTMPKGGFGNLIALPMQKEARKQGNSEFVDQKLKPYGDQWAYLSKIHKLPPEKVNQIIALMTINNQPIGNLRASAEEEDLPWEKVTKSEPGYENLPAQVNVFVSNMIFIEKGDLPQKLINRIIRLAAFLNPDYYRTQALRLPLYNKPRIINLSSESLKHIAIPRGCLEDLIKMFEQLSVESCIQDKTEHGLEQSFEFRGNLYDEQQKAGKELLRYSNGILSASTAFGKTVVALWLVSQRKTSTLIIVHRRQLLQQWKERIACFLNIPLKEIGEIGAGKDKRTMKIDIAIIHSLYRNQEVKEFVQDYGMVIVDECHHISAFSFEQVLKAVKARYVYGLTATPIRKDGQHPIMTMQCGHIRYIVESKNNLQTFTQSVIIKDTDFTLPALSNSAILNIVELYNALTEDEARNNVILDDVIAAVVARRSPLILTERTAHVDFFEEKLTGFAKNIIVLKGGMGRKQLKAIMDKLHSIPEHEERLIIATGKYIGEGFDDSRLDTLFLTMPISWKGTLQQYAGRLHRTHESKTDVLIYDYVDRNVPVFAAMYQKRSKGYKSMGYSVREI
ncbi:MAG: DEAD/DEAH box helicase family protein [Candidatus Cloacimonetes bacterium]|nr:DEAD/DEAH box helicase family protein [Candidatus Cloacimonadota bacterium]